jgi:hypothetical protein
MSAPRRGPDRSGTAAMSAHRLNSITRTPRGVPTLEDATVVGAAVATAAACHRRGGAERFAPELSPNLSQAFDFVGAWATADARRPRISRIPSRSMPVVPPDRQGPRPDQPQFTLIADSNRSLPKRNRSLDGSRSGLRILENHRTETRYEFHRLRCETPEFPRQRPGSWPLTQLSQLAV